LVEGKRERDRRENEYVSSLVVTKNGGEREIKHVGPRFFSLRTTAKKQAEFQFLILRNVRDTPSNTLL